MTPLDDIIEARGKTRGGHNPIDWIRFFGGEPVPISFFEPDPETFRSEYYYNSRLNKLFRKLPTNPCADDPNPPVWKPISQL